MTEQLTLSQERVDDMALWLAQLDRRQVAKRLEECCPSPGKWEGLSIEKIHLKANLLRLEGKDTKTAEREG
jgi:hypothetical protein